MFSVDSVDEGFLLKSIEAGEVVIVLGAGASSSSTNRAGQDVKVGWQLAAAIAADAGQPYEDEDLGVVLGAVKSLLSDEKILSIYKREYYGVTPSRELSELFKYAWKRLYTWNIDDSLDVISARGSQRPKSFNGMVDAVVESDDLGLIQIIKLHGDINHPEHGFIMTEAEYNRALIGQNHQWYRQAARDYITSTPIFIGSRLKEIILSAEIERAKREPNASSGRAFAITPDRLTKMERANLETKGIIHVEATLSNFVEWLKTKFPIPPTPKDIVLGRNRFADKAVAGRITKSDLPTASRLYRINYSEVANSLSRRTPILREAEARNFLVGSPPSWELAAASVPVWLVPTTALYREFTSAITERKRLFVVTGQSGSGKTTAILQSFLKYVRDLPEAPVYELRGDVRSMRSVLGLLARLHDEHVILYVGDLFIFGDTFKDDIESIDSGRVTIISTARSGEWNEHLDRHMGQIATTHDYSRFTKADYQPLIEKLLEYVPAPELRRAKPQERLEIMAKSKDQLLIALREATSSRSFSDTISDEYQKLPDGDTRALLAIVGIATMARVGADVGFAKEVYSAIARSRSFEKAELALSGIVSRHNGHRLFARHEIYVRHIVENLLPLEDLIDVLIEMLRYFTKYEVPVIKSVNKFDAAIFKFVLNHAFVMEHCKRKGSLRAGEHLYASFDISFQLDGHFWLQYGLYLAQCGRISDALTMLRRSTEAYRNNAFAVHAYAELQLRQAMRRDIYDDVTMQLVAEAVKALTELDAKSDLVDDQYPIVTLATHHIGVLLKHVGVDEAKRYARIYFDRLQDLEKRGASGLVSRLKGNLFNFVVTGAWHSGTSKSQMRKKRLRGREYNKDKGRI